MTTSTPPPGPALRRTALPGRPAALLLDMDGTLVDSEPVHREGYRRFFAARGWPADESTYALFTGRRADDVFASTPGPWAGLDPVELYHEVVRHMPADERPLLVAGAVELLDTARRVGVPVALVTSADRPWAQRALAELAGLDAFDAVVTRDEVDRGKPHPEPYLRAAALLHAAPAECLACEDAPDGIASALAAGVGHVIGVTTSSPAGRLTRAGAHSTAADHHGLVEALTKA